METLGVSVGEGLTLVLVVCWNPLPRGDSATGLELVGEKGRGEQVCIQAVSQGWFGGGGAARVGGPSIARCVSPRARLSGCQGGEAGRRRAYTCGVVSVLWWLSDALGGPPGLRGRPSKGELGWWQWGGSTEHLPPPLGKGEGDLGPHIFRQGGRVRSSSHGQGFG